MRATLTAAFLLACGIARAEDTIAFAGLASSTVAGEDLARLENAVAGALSDGMRIVGRDTLASSLEVQSALATARSATAASDVAQREFKLAEAAADLDQAIASFDEADAARVVPAELAQAIEQRARLAYALGNQDDMRAAFARLVRVDPDRKLDAGAFPPDALVIHAEALATARATPPAAPDPSMLVRLARRSRARWAAGGEVRLRDGGLDIALAMAGADGAIASRAFRIGSRDALDPSVERAVEAIFIELGVTREIAIATPVLVSTPRPIVTPAPRDRRWMLWAGAIALGLAAGVAAVEASDSGPSPTPEPGVTVRFPNPP